MRPLIVLSIALAAAPAGAYPQFQFSTGATRCNQCHFAPAGGGLLNNYGREESADTISSGGNGGFLHGLWEPPDWLALGADLRFAGLLNDVGATHGFEPAFFPMQGDLYARAQVGPMSLSLTTGLRGAVRHDEPSLFSRLISREHYLMWQPRRTGPYARVGRFFAPYGLRLAEHPLYVRRWLGFNTLEETYNASGGYIDDGWELHATAFTPDFLRPVGQRGSGGAVLFEKRLGGRASVGGQARVAIASRDTRAQGGLVGKLYLEGPRLLLFAQLDLVAQDFKAEGLGGRGQLAGLAGATWLVRRGFMVTGFLERWDEDLAVRGVSRNALSASAQWFPTAHVEVSLFGRVQMIGTGRDDGDFAELVLLQLHYYL